VSADGKEADGKEAAVAAAANVLSEKPNLCDSFFVGKNHALFLLVNFWYNYVYENFEVK